MDILRASCPNCRQKLRIPADWAAKSMRCLRCKIAIRAKDPSAVPQTDADFAPIPPPSDWTKPPPPSIPVGLPVRSPGWMPAWVFGAPSPTIYQPMPESPPVVLLPAYRAPEVVAVPIAAPVVPPPLAVPISQPVAQVIAQPVAPHETPRFFDLDDHDPEEEADRFLPSESEYPPTVALLESLPESGEATIEPSLARRVRSAPNDGMPRVIVTVGFLAIAVVLAVALFMIPNSRPTDRSSFAKNLRKVNDPADGPGRTPLAGIDPKAKPWEGLPRRALFIAPENYFHLNTTLWYQSRDGQIGNIQNALVYRFTQGAPLGIDRSQVYILTDSGYDTSVGAAPLKPTVEAAIKDFCETSRPQDCVVVFFSGHACEIDGKGYLIPLDAEAGDKDRCIPLDWVYDRLAACKSRQKVLVVDAFRFPPARGLELPNTGPMTAAFEKHLANPPPGVRTVTACVAGQQSLEFESGSLFQTAIRHALHGLSFREAVHPRERIPLEDVVAKVNEQLAKELKKSSPPTEPGEAPLTQTCRLFGREGTDDVEPNPDEPAPRAIAFVPTNRNLRDGAIVRGILDEILRFPPMKTSQATQFLYLSDAAFPSTKELDDYRDDGFNPFRIDDDAAIKARRDKYPHRVLAYEIAAKINEHFGLPMKEYFANPGGPLDAQAKRRFLDEQRDPALASFEMEELLYEANKLAELRDDEKSKRWRAHFDLAVARLQSRLVYVYEYTSLIAQIRSESLPTLEPFHSGWRVNTSPKLTMKEPTVKELAKQTAKRWDRLAADYPNTPWAFIAKRERNVAMGLKWIPTKE